MVWKSFDTKEYFKIKMYYIMCYKCRKDSLIRVVRLYEKYVQETSFKISKIIWNIEVNERQKKEKKCKITTSN